MTCLHGFYTQICKMKSFRLDKKLILLAILCLWVGKNVAQTHKIDWRETETSESGQVLNFKGAHYQYSKTKLPLVSHVLTASNVSVKLKNEVFEDLLAVELKSDFSFVQNECIIITTPLMERKQTSTYIEILPFRKDATTGKIQKLISYELENIVLSNPISGNRTTAATFINNSVLASGNWYKVGVVDEGIYKMSYDFLRNSGINAQDMTLNSIRLYGNGGGMVPLLNSEARPDDLLENAIQIVDADNNGNFNSGDYVLFYGQEQTKWTYSAAEKRYNHQINLFSDTTYYFITTMSTGQGKRIATLSSSTDVPTRNVRSFTDYAFHEEESQNFLKSGRKWYGETFDVVLKKPFTFSFRDLIPGTVSLKSSVLGRTSSDLQNVSSRFTVAYSGTTYLTHIIPAVGTFYTNDYGRTSILYTTFNGSSSPLTFDYTFLPYNSSSVGYLDYVSINVTRSLNFSNNSLRFRDRDTNNVSSISNYQISNANNNLQLWNVTTPYDVKKQQFSILGSTLEFNKSLAANDFAEYVLFDLNAVKEPVFYGKVVNQNLHNLSAADLLIITTEEFKSEAERLASFRRSNDNLRVNVVTKDQVYNEFSSGSQDVAALRDFTRMFYERASTNPTDLPRYLLLMGDGSYDLKYREENNTNFIPTFQSDNSISVLTSYTSDDFYGMMDPIEGTLQGAEIMDIGVGRLPVKTLQEAREAVDKIIIYSTIGDANVESVCNGTSSTRLGDWRNVITFIADDQDRNTHFNQQERIINSMSGFDDNFNFDKIVIDAYQQISTPGGQRYPDVNDAINKRIEKGTLLVNYTGHGGELGWAAEAILSNDMINKWTNINNIPVFITSTCEFSRYDDPGRNSAGENIFLNSKGGGICLFTTVRLAFAYDNELINIDYLRYMFNKVNGVYNRAGDIQRLAKRDNPSNRNPTLLGDPSLTISHPNYKVVSTSLEDAVTGIAIDTLRALARVTVKGKVTDTTGNTLTNFNGVVFPTVYDKEVLVNNLVNDPTGGDISLPGSFMTRKSILYRGKASVKNGLFTSTFIVPKDIAYQYGKGRLSYYAQNESTDATGSDESFTIGGTSSTNLNDTVSPAIQLYMNSESFVSGGLTSQSPKIYAILNDSSGINTVGNGIGHDITAQLDGSSEKLFVLNDYYESDLDNFQKGRVVYSLDNLSPGLHTLTLKAWDINNNSATAYTEFVVSESTMLTLDHVLNYPNPFTTKTTFFFEHNKPCIGMNVQIQIYTVTGKIIKTLDSYKVCDGFRNTSIEWDGKDEFGDQLAKGVYVYRLKVRTEDGESTEKLERLVILR